MTEAAGLTFPQDDVADALVIPAKARKVKARRAGQILNRGESKWLIRIFTGLPDVRLYDVRHSTATALMAAGVNVKIVAERLGHSSVKITLGIYSHVSEGMQKQASDVIEAAIAG